MEDTGDLKSPDQEWSCGFESRSQYQITTTMNGFRKMISDNIPKTWDLALRWCHCRTKWIEYIYNVHIAPLNNDWRDERTRKSLKEKRTRMLTSPKRTRFFDTINHDRMLLEDKEAYEAWKSVSNWVTWFSEQYAYITSSAKIQMECKGTSIDDTAEYINKRYKLNNIKLAKFIIDSIV